MLRKVLIGTIAFTMAACATAPQQSPAGNMNLSDGEVAGVLMAINEGEIMHGEIARTRASSTEVRSFADMMVRDHTAALERLRGVVSQSNITPAENDLVRTLRTGAEQTATALRAMSGAEFDRAYMRSQVEMHDWVLRSIDTSLLPSTQSSRLMMLERDARPAIAGHLEHARRIHGTLR